MYKLCNLFVLDPPMCSVGFLDKDTIISVSRTTQPVVRSGGFQRIFPDINFSSNGSITKWILGGVDIFGGNLPELQIWRLVGPQFIKVGATSFTPNATSNTNVHAMYPSPPVEFQAGDVFGIFTPFDLNSSLTVLFQRFNGPANRLMITLNPPAPTVLPNNCIPEFYHGENNYPLVSVEVQTMPRATPSLMTISADGTLIPLSSTVYISSMVYFSSPITTTTTTIIPSPTQSAVVSPTDEPNTQPIADIVLYVLSGAVAGVVVTIVTIVIVICIVCLCVRVNKKHKVPVRAAPQNSLRDNPCYGNRVSNGSDSIGTTSPRIDSVMYETIDVQTSLHNNPSYTSSLDA